MTKPRVSHELTGRVKAFQEKYQKPIGLAVKALELAGIEIESENIRPTTIRNDKFQASEILKQIFDNINTDSLPYAGEKLPQYGAQNGHILGTIPHESDFPGIAKRHQNASFVNTMLFHLESFALDLKEGRYDSGGDYIRLSDQERSAVIEGCKALQKIEHSFIGDYKALAEELHITRLALDAREEKREARGSATSILENARSRPSISTSALAALEDRGKRQAARGR